MLKPAAFARLTISLIEAGDASVERTTHNARTSSGGAGASLNETGSGPGAPKDVWLRQGDETNQIVIHAKSRDMVQGVVRLHFIMDREGRVLSYNVVGSSGFATLDDAARALIRRAQPLPPVPADYPGETLDLIVPVVFSLR